MKRSARIIKRQTITGFVLAAVVFLLGFVGILYGTNRNVLIRTRTIQTVQSMERMTTLYSVVLDAEASQKGYLLTGDPRYLVPYEATIQRIDGLFKEVEEILQSERNTKVHLDDIARLRALIRQKLDLLEAIIDLKRTGRNSESLALIHQKQGQELMDGIRGEIDRFLQIERALQQTLSAELETTLSRRIFSLGVLFGFAFVVMGLMLRAILRQFGRMEKLHGKLQNNEERLRLAIAAGRMGTWEYDAETQIIQFSDAFAQMNGLSADVNQGHVSMVFEKDYPEDRERTRLELIRAVKEGKDFDIVRRLLFPGGEIRWIQCRGRAFDVQWGRGRRLFGIAMDITDAKRTEALVARQQQALVHSTRMSALGEMAKGVAHEINNPLAAITAQAQVLQLELENRDEFQTFKISRVQERVERIVSSVERAARIIQGLRDFARDGSHDRLESTDLSLVIQRAVGLCARSFEDAGVILLTEIADPGVKLWCRPIQLSQAIFNLLQNALYAAKHCETQPKSVRLDVQSDPQGVSILVQDSGTGVPVDIRDRIMDPFFTTKPLGSGTGMGLSIARGLIEQNGGTLELVEDQMVTTFRIRLPRHEPQQQPGLVTHRDTLTEASKTQSFGASN